MAIAILTLLALAVFLAVGVTGLCLWFYEETYEEGGYWYEKDKVMRAVRDANEPVIGNDKDNKSNKERLVF